MRLQVEVTTRPFVGEPHGAPAHAIRALNAATESGLTARALGPIVEAALQAGAERVTLRAHRTDAG